MLLLDSRGVYRGELLSKIPGLEHGFGTRLSEKWPKRPVIALKQVHSDRVIPAGEATAETEGDALITGDAGKFLSIRTADCLPLLFADPKKRVVAAAHAGWRGTVAEIAARTVEAMEKRFGSDPRDIKVALGPCIDECCFEVGPEVATQFRKFLPERQDLDRVAKISLREVNIRQLLSRGIRAEQIEMSDACTKCRTEVFHSYRRDGKAAGRMTAMIGLFR